MKKSLLLFPIVFFISFVVYLSTLAPDVGFTDSGELAVVCATLGIAHPTGYPLYTLLGHCWTYMPIGGSVVWKMNVFSAWCSSLFAVLLFGVLRDMGILLSARILSEKGAQQSNLGENHISIVAACISLTVAFASTFWDMAVGNEVYSLQILLFVSLIWLFLRGIYDANEHNGKKFFLLWALMLGLSFGNHGTTILLAPAMLLLYFKRPGKQFSIVRGKEIVWLAAPFLLALGIWLYLPLRSAANPEFNWGEVHRSWDKFWYHATGKQFQVWMFEGRGIWKDHGKLLLQNALDVYSYLGLPLAAVGLVVVWKYSRELWLFVVLCTVSCLAYSMNYGIHDIEPYFSLAFISLSFFVFFGILFLIRKYPKYAIASVLLPISSLAANYANSNRSDDYAVSEFTNALVSNLPKNTVILSSQWDYWCSAFWYKQHIEKLRPDIVLVEKELLRRTWYSRQLARRNPDIFLKMQSQKQLFEEWLERFESDPKSFESNRYNISAIQRSWIGFLRAIIDSNMVNRPVYATLDVLQTEPEIAALYEKIPEGFSVKLEKKGIFPKQNITIQTQQIEKINNSLQGRNGKLYDGLRDNISANLVNSAHYALKYSDDKSLTRTLLKNALKIDSNNYSAGELYHSLR